MCGLILAKVTLIIIRWQELTRPNCISDLIMGAGAIWVLFSISLSVFSGDFPILIAVSVFFYCSFALFTRLVFLPGLFALFASIVSFEDFRSISGSLHLSTTYFTNGLQAIIPILVLTKFACLFPFFAYWTSFHFVTQNTKRPCAIASLVTDWQHKDALRSNYI